MLWLRVLEAERFLWSWGVLSNIELGSASVRQIGAVTPTGRTWVGGVNAIPVGMIDDEGLKG